MTDLKGFALFQTEDDEPALFTELVVVDEKELLKPAVKDGSRRVWRLVLEK